MNFVLTRDAEEFAAQTERLPRGRIECNVTATVLINLRQSVVSGEEALFAYSLDGAGDPSAAAMRVPPWPLLTSPLEPPAAAELGHRWPKEDPEVSGVVGLPAAGGAVAAASRRALSQGAEKCMLFTDLANPTSNKIYAEVGFRPIGEWGEHEFERPGAPRSP